MGRRGVRARVGLRRWSMLGAASVAVAFVGPMMSLGFVGAAEEGVQKPSRAARVRVPVEKVRAYVEAGDIGVVKGSDGELEVDAEGPCASAIESRCPVEAKAPKGDGRIFDCLGHGEDGGAARGPWGRRDGFGGRASGVATTGAAADRMCTITMMAYSREMDRTFDDDQVMKDACVEDAEKLCSDELERQRAGAHAFYARWMKETDGEGATNGTAKGSSDEGKEASDEEDESDAFEVGELDGIVVECLRKNRAKVSARCRAGLVNRGEREAENVQFDTTVWRACKDQAKEVCPGVSPGGGKLWECLKKNAQRLKGKCKEAMDVNDEEDAEDFRLDLTLRDACEDERVKYCSDVAYGGGRVRTCLEDKRKKVQNLMDFKGGAFPSVFRRNKRGRGGTPPAGGRRALAEDAEATKSRNVTGLAGAWASAAAPVPGFSAECIQVLDERMVRAQDRWKMDPNVHEQCAAEVSKLCAKEDSDEDAEDAAAQGSLGEVMACLQDAIYRASPKFENAKADVVSEGCAAAVKWETGAMFEKVEFDPRLKVACGDEIKARCTEEGQLWDEEPVESVIACLYMSRGLSNECRAEVQRQAILSSKSLEFKPQLAYACSNDVPTLCPGQAGRGVGGGTLECLRGKVNDRSMSAECKAAITEDLEVASHDIRMEFDLYDACRTVEIPEYCGDEMAALLKASNVNATVAAGLTSSEWNSGGTEQGPGVGDGPSHGEVIQCLRDNFEYMEENGACQKQILQLVQRQSYNARLDSTLEEACADDVSEDLGGVCSSVAPGGGKLQLCLRDHLDELKPDCLNHISKAMRDEAYSIELMPAMRRSCGGEVAQRCPNLEPGRGRVIECLKDDVDDPMMDGTCLKQLQRLIRSQGSDFLSDWPLAEACGSDLTRLCPGSTSTGSQRPYVNPWACLVEHEKVLPSSCRHQLRKSIAEGLRSYSPMSTRLGVCDDALHEICTSSPPPTTAYFTYDAYECLTSQVTTEDSKPAKKPAKKPVLADNYPDCYELVSFASSDVSLDVQTAEFIEKNQEEFPVPQEGEPAWYVDGPFGLLLFVSVTALLVWGCFKCIGGQLDNLARFGQGVQQGWAEQGREGRARPVGGRAGYTRVSRTD